MTVRDAIELTLNLLADCGVGDWNVAVVDESAHAKAQQGLQPRHQSSTRACSILQVNRFANNP